MTRRPVESSLLRLGLVLLLLGVVALAVSYAPVGDLGTYVVASVVALALGGLGALLLVGVLLARLARWVLHER